MDSEMTTYLVVGLILGIIIGIIFTNIMSPKSRKYNQVKRDLDETKQELVNQKQMIVKHFSHSAEILDNMAKEFRRLYQHMAENSSHLISPEDIDKTLNVTSTMHLNDDSEISINISDKDPITDAEPPKDYSGNPSGLLKNEENKS